MQRRPDVFRVLTIDKYAFLGTGLSLTMIALLCFYIFLPLPRGWALFWVLVGLVLGTGGAILRYRYIDWVFTHGQVVEGYLERTGIGAQGSHPYRAFVTYTYGVDGVSYRVQNLYHLDATTRFWKRGDRVKVIYDPRHPEQAFIVDVFAS